MINNSNSNQMAYFWISSGLKVNNMSTALGRNKLLRVITLEKITLTMFLVEREKYEYTLTPDGCL